MQVSESMQVEQTHACARAGGRRQTGGEVGTYPTCASDS